PKAKSTPHALRQRNDRFKEQSMQHQVPGRKSSVASKKPSKTLRRAAIIFVVILGGGLIFELLRLIVLK
ncbi:uncharacterized protein L969DRAFT_50025, partial [Mixia osmundae IAM 14324]